MTNLNDLKPPKDFAWQPWIERWDRMQERYVVRRAERFDTIVRLLRATQQPLTRVLDLGCGPGSLTVAVLKAFPQAEVCGIDFDPAMLWLATARLAEFGVRVVIKQADLREESWTREVPRPLDAAVSATALHWLAPDRLAQLYCRLAQVLRPGGIFLNTDHAGSDYPLLQQAWESHRSEILSREARAPSDDWDGFWREYSQALGLELKELQECLLEGGVEEGLPLSWHLDKLRECGFVHVDCFWRCQGEAIYGGFRKE